MKPRGTVLVVEDDEPMRQLLEDELREAHFDVMVAANGVEALDRMSDRGDVDVVVTDLVMPAMKGRELLSEIRLRDPDVPVVIITAFGSIESAVESMRAGAYHYVAKPFPIEQLLTTVEGALRQRRFGQELLGLRGTQGRTGIVAESPAMMTPLQTLLRAAPVDSPVLLIGESGTGKELLARALHAESPRRKAPFVAVNCSAIPETLLESQLFGYRRGAFTDAREDQRGLFQEAKGGTMFLDEIGDMPPALQGKLLRVLQEKEVHPLGAPAPVPVDVRIVSATNRNLELLVEEGRFRRDLYYRLEVIVVRVPPLRERVEDLVPLVAHLLDKHGKRLGRLRCTLTLEALDVLQRHDWPGNVRELENVIERGLVLGRDNVIGIEDLPPAIRMKPRPHSAPGRPCSLAELERDHIRRTLEAANGNRAAAARMLGLDRKTLYRKLKLYDIA